MNLEQLYEQAQQSIAQDQHNDAYKVLRKIDAALPDHPGVLYLLGVCQSKSGNKLNAIRSYRRALQLMPNFVEAANNLALDLKATDQPEEALQLFRQALALRPDFFDAKLNLASLLIDLNKSSESLQLLNELLATHPTHPMVLSNLGRALLGMRRENEARLHFEKALLAQPDNFEILKGLSEASKASKNWGQFQQAINQFIKTFPNHLPAKGLLHEALLFQGQWSELEKIEAEIAALSAAQQADIGLKPFCILSRFADGADQLRLISGYQNTSTLARNPKPIESQHPKLRVGYISPDFKDHPVSYLTSGIFKNHDLNKFETFAIALDPNPPSADNFRTQIKDAVIGFYEAGEFSDQEIVKLLNDLKLDLLIDLTGHTTGARPRLLQARCAPLQLQFLGFPGSMGANYIDYTIGDPIVSPIEHQKFYSEQLILLPECFQPNDQNRPITAGASRKDFGLPESGFVFGCFNQGIKITRTLFEIWLRILNRVPDSVLWLVGENQSQVKNMIAFAGSQGIAPERLIFAERTDYASHLGRYARIDLVLDTFPFNGGTTTSDALWGGAPVITLIGESYASRMSASILHSLGLDELITNTPDNYESLATNLALNPEICTKIRNQLTQARTQSPTFNIERYTRHFESGLEMAYQRTRQGLKPETFLVPRITA